jgi:hypothetical protein
MGMNGQIGSETVKETGRARWKGLAKNMGIAFMAAFFIGILYGLLLRLVMGIIAFFYPHMASGFSISGTMLLVVLGVAVTLANSIVYTFTFQSSRMSWGRKGIYFGLLSLLIYGIPLFLSNPNNELFGPQAPLGITLFSLLFFIGSFGLAFSVERITRWLNHSNRRQRLAYICFAIFVIPATIMLVNMILEIFYEMIPQIIQNFS